MMWTSTVEAEPALPAQPEMVIGDSTVVRSGMATSLPLVPEQPGGPLTVNVNVVVCVTLVPVPVIVTVYVPAGVEGPVESVNVDDPPELTEAGLNDAVAPLGRPLAERVIVCAAPLVNAVPIVLVSEPPGSTAPELGEA